MGILPEIVNYPIPNYSMPPRFYYPDEIIVGHSIELPLDIRHHATRVLRLKLDDSITLFNGKGGEYIAQIIYISKSNTTVLIQEHNDIERESPLIIELAQTICANEKMDWIIQKAVELGVTSIQPIITDRSIVRLSHERANKRLQHWKKITISACEQCGRNRLPHIKAMKPLSDWLSDINRIKTGQALRFMLSATAKENLRHIPPPASYTTLTVTVGPEGGFTQAEETAILDKEFIALRLGKRILRTETAALSIISAMQTLWGDY